MVRGIRRGLDRLIDNYAVTCILLAQFIMTLLGVGDVRIISLLGLLLCAVGLVQRSAQVDLWVFVPLVIYNLVGMASSCAAYGNITDGYASLQLILPVLYLLTACLEPQALRLLKRLCVIWAGAAAAAGLVRFAAQAVLQGRASRLGGVLGNPNALGIFLVLGWFLLMDCRAGGENFLLSRIEPVLLFALALTLSLGSFAAMAAGVLVLLWLKKRSASWRETFRYGCILLARASLGVGTGVLIYLSAARTDVPWVCLPLLLYGAAVAVSWPSYERFLEFSPRTAALISALGTAVALTLVAVRPSSIATFTERLEMMASASRYLAVNPLLGVGPYRWRMLDLYDGGKYFNTWHIHNALLHAGVELGWIAMAMLAVIVIRAFRKRKEDPVRAGWAAFCVHNMMDTSFFYLGIASLALIAAEDPRGGGKKLGGAELKVLFGLFAALFAVHFVYALGAA